MDKSELKSGRPAPGARVFEYQVVSVRDGNRTTVFDAPQVVRRNASGVDITTMSGEIVHFETNATLTFGKAQRFVSAGAPLPNTLRTSAKRIGVVRADGTY